MSNRWWLLSEQDEDDFDDSSSISSGVSDAVGEISTDDNLTNSSVNSELSNHHRQYENAKQKAEGDGNQVGVNGACGRREQPPLAYRVVGSRGSSGKKSDSSQQTETSAFRQISNTQWKKFVENGKPALAQAQAQAYQQQQQQQQQPPVQEFRRGKSDLESIRNREKRNSVGSSYANGPPVNGPLGLPQGPQSALPKKQDKRTPNAAVNVPQQQDPRKKGMGVKDDLNKDDKRSPKVPSTSMAQPPMSVPSGSSGHSSRVNGDSRRMHAARGVPASFGYVKRPTSAGPVCKNGGGPGANGPTPKSRENPEEMRTAQVSGVPRVDTAKGERSLERPRTKVKVSGGTQTTSDLLGPGAAHHPTPHHSEPDYSRHGYPPQQNAPPQYKSYSLTAPSASQLSQNVRDRLLGSQSLPKSSSAAGADYAGFYAGFHHQHPGGGYSRERSPRLPKPTDGSLSDTAYSNYAELHGYNRSSPYAWVRHSPSYAAGASAGGNLIEADSVESLSSASSSLAAQLQHARAGSLTHARLMMHQREMSASPSPRLNRSNSIRSTKSEKLYPSMLQRTDDLDGYYSTPLSLSTAGHRDGPHSSQPTSPTPSQVSQGTASSRFNFAPISSSASNHGLCRLSMTPYTGILAKIPSKEDDVHGSSLSLVSTTSSLYSTQEEKQAHEIRKLRRELGEAQEKVHTLTSQLSTNAHVVAAFEQSLSNMTQRLQHLTATAEQKDTELLDLRQTIELLRKQSAEAGLTSANFQNPNNGNMARQLSTDSVSSINSLSSACSATSHTSHNSGPSQNSADSPSAKKKKKKGWLRSSFSKAFSRSKKNKNGSVSDVEDSRGLHSDISAPSSPLLNTPHQMNGGGSNSGIVTANGNGGQGMKISHSSSAIYNKESDAAPEVVADLKKQLREKEMVLTDIRLEALSSAHQLDSLKETVCKMRSDMMNLKNDNERLQRMVTSKSLASSQSSLGVADGVKRRQSTSDCTAPTGIDVLLGDPNDKDGKRITLSVLMGSCNPDNKVSSECLIGCISVGAKTKWDLLDNLVKRIFKEYVFRVDPVSNLGLTVESVWAYHVGEVTRSKEAEVPELLPCGYLIGDVTQIRVSLRGPVQTGSVDSLAFETLIPKSIIQRYVSLLTEHRRIILCGPSGTGKSYLATKLAEFLVLRSGREPSAEVIATFGVDHKSSKELRQYLANIAEQCESNAADLPQVIILDNLHHAGSLGEVFNGFLNAKYSKCPYIIGTMNQATCSTTNLQLHHNFRWVLCANHMEPVKGFLGRFLRRRLIEVEVRVGVRLTELGRVLEWVPRVWHHLNKFLETHSSSDVTIGPRLFLSCPADVSGSQVWFTDLWNYSIIPYLLEAVREGLQLYGRRAPWEDPTSFLLESYPWTNQGGSSFNSNSTSTSASSSSLHTGQDALLRLRPEDVGYDTQMASSGVGVTGSTVGGSVKSLGSAQSDNEADPLLNMLMRLQEAANYSSPHSNDSDSASLDLHATDDLLVSSGMESTL